MNKIIIYDLEAYEMRLDGVQSIPELERQKKRNTFIFFLIKMALSVASG